jgi:hypothetical protein
MATPREDLQRELKNPVFAFWFYYWGIRDRIGLFLYKIAGNKSTKLQRWMDGV